ncbi:MAG: LytR/AlgR family response regulator transcription factor [Planctomycetota bacterium]
MSADAASLRCLVVDDEPSIRAHVCEVLGAADFVTVVGEAGDGPAAIEAIERLRPDVVLLDVQMPGCDGFDVLGHFAAADRPTVVFVTAYEQYALRAFDPHAIDYLLKPFDDERLLRAVQRAAEWEQARLRSSVPASGPQVPRLLAQVAESRTRDRFIVKQGGRVRVLAAHEVQWIEARGNYVHLHHSDGAFLLRETLAALADTLDDRRFVRVHRSAIVALDQVQELVRAPSGAYSLKLKSGGERRWGAATAPRLSSAGVDAFAPVARANLAWPPSRRVTERQSDRAAE